ncbi:hypothetical protein [Desulfobacter hydrogenophilus]|uniref:hypothetical protein n=1 Tax=Desulfobacter hydrogenophilus TaxID=2291 RepID=UPI001A93F8A9|nr:hypothetical protein [Desulfobacter hydrogenophilus]
MLVWKPLYWDMAVKIILPKFWDAAERLCVKRAAEVAELPMRTVQKLIGKVSDEYPKICNAGGGRKPYWISNPEIDEQFLDALRDHTAGDPMDEKIRWTNLRAWEIVEALKDEHGIEVS